MAGSTSPEQEPARWERVVDESCPACEARSVTELTFTMKNGDRAQMRHCSRCEERRWYCNGTESGLADVVDAVQREGLPHGRR